ncbi:TPA: hypothetical protein ACGO7W_000989, partial [Streptococcus suis]
RRSHHNSKNQQTAHLTHPCSNQRRHSEGFQNYLLHSQEPMIELVLEVDLIKISFFQCLTYQHFLKN